MEEATDVNYHSVIKVYGQRSLYVGCIELDHKLAFSLSKFHSQCPFVCFFFFNFYATIFSRVPFLDENGYYFSHAVETENGYYISL
mmetsp:Transcript_2817/g.3219  ORF Transcript_2817/g.3219 Transcript_2817/m.3219 type:complete len:86 (+) Transcript_2817:1348-1605(+)